jgi:hypothetical protein
VSLIIPPGFGNAAFIFTGGAGTPEFVTTLGVDLANAGGDFVGVANALGDIYATAWAAETDSAFTLDRVNLAVGQDGPGGSVDSDFTPIPMTRSGTGPPVSMAVVLRKVTNEIGRRGRGRMFMPGLLTTANVDESGIVASGRRGEINTAAENFYELLTDALGVATAYDPVLLHGAAPADPDPIVGFQASTIVGWIRGRIR